MLTDRSNLLLAASDAWTWAPIGAAAVAGTLALVGIAANLAASRRDRRAELYAEAFKAALAMVEMVYRARRAGDNLRGVVDRYHQIHEDINFHQGWIEVESQEMGRAYRRLILRVRAATREPINQALAAIRQGEGASAETWDKGVTGGHPDVMSAKADFLDDVADHLSWRRTRRRQLRERYTDLAWRRIRASLPQASGGTFYDPPAA